MITRSGGLLSVAVLLAACGQGAVGGTQTAAPAQTTAAPAQTTVAASAAPVGLTVFAAASLKDAVTEAAGVYGVTFPGTTPTVSTDSSAALETQIEQGAPADLFLSADTANPNKLVEGGFASGPTIVFAGNELTIVVPKDDPGGVTTPVDIGKADLRIIAAGNEVPITKYADTLVANLAATPGYPSDLLAIYQAHVVSREDNVNAVIAKIELGEGDAAIVYVTDAKASDKVGTVQVPESANVPATYAGVVVKASPNTQAAQAFLDWLAGRDGQAILAKYGFLPPPP